MHKPAKYIVFDDPLNFVAVVFPNFINHSDIASDLRYSIGPPVSAGFVRWEDGKPVAYGRSESLNLDCAPIDTKLIRKQIHQ